MSVLKERSSRTLWNRIKERFVEKEEGKGLSSNDFTNNDKKKVDTINSKQDKLLKKTETVYVRGRDAAGAKGTATINVTDYNYLVIRSIGSATTSQITLDVGAYTIGQPINVKGVSSVTITNTKTATANEQSVGVIYELYNIDTSLTLEQYIKTLAKLSDLENYLPLTRVTDSALNIDQATQEKHMYKVPTLINLKTAFQSGFWLDTEMSDESKNFVQNKVIKEYVDNAVAAVSTLTLKPVDELPAEDISTTTIYLVPNGSNETQNVRDEYINLNGTSDGWEKIGSTQIDLSGYATKQYVDDAIARIEGAYATKEELAEELTEMTDEEIEGICE